MKRFSVKAPRRQYRTSFPRRRRYIWPVGASYRIPNLLSAIFCRLFVVLLCGRCTHHVAHLHRLFAVYVNSCKRTRRLCQISTTERRPRRHRLCRRIGKVLCIAEQYELCDNLSFIDLSIIFNDSFNDYSANIYFFSFIVNCFTLVGC